MALSEFNMATFHSKIVDAIPIDWVSPTWKHNQRSMREIIYSNLDNKTKFQKLQAETHVSLQGRTDLVQNQVNWWLAYLQRANLIQDLEIPVHESEMFRNEKSLLLDGITVSPDLLRKLTYNLLIKRAFPDICSQEHISVMELGAGYGQMARVFRELNPQCTYIIVDIPDTIVFSITYLLTNYPDAKYIIIDKKSGFDSISLRNFDFVFVVASFEECLSGQQIDLFINTHSLGEMPNKTISYYFDLIQSKLEVKGIWVLNRFLNRLKPESMNRINENISSVSLDRNWHVREWEFEPGFLKCPFLRQLKTNACISLPVG